MNPFRPRPPQHRTPVARRVADLEVLSARLMRGGFAGDYHSAFLGQGIEFAQVREYQPGDDIRTIDWNVTARSGVPHVKQFIEERDLTIVLAVDVSGSMDFGSVDWRKSDIAAELAAVFAFSAVQNSDRVGMLLFADDVRAYIPPRRGRAHAQVLVRHAVDAAMQPRRPVLGEPRATSGADSPRAGRADLGKAVAFLQRVHARRGVVIVVSDFLDVDFEAPLRRLHGRQDVVALAVTDPREERLPSSGLARLRDAESGAMRWVDLGGINLQTRALQRSEMLARKFRAAGVDWMRISTAAPYERDLVRFFRERVQRRR